MKTIIYLLIFVSYIAILTTAAIFNFQRTLKPVPKVIPPKPITSLAISYPVRFVYINKIRSYSTPQKIAAGMGVPTYASPTIYNYIAFAFWTYSKGPLDIAKVWSYPTLYFGTNSVFGKTNDEIQKNLKKKYNDKGIKIFVSAFGATQHPTTAGFDPIQCATKLSNFVLNNNLDGVDIDWEDNSAMSAGKGQDWLIKFQTQLRRRLPNHLITHAPQAPYFKKQYYKNGAYVTIHNKVGSTINFYNVQFYNQGSTSYNAYKTLFQQSGSVFSKTSVTEILARGIPSNKIVVGKPVTQSDAYNTGLVSHTQLGAWIKQAYTQYKWYAGVMYWQYASDLNGIAIKNSTGYLRDQCAINRNCI